MILNLSKFHESVQVIGHRWNMAADISSSPSCFGCILDCVTDPACICKCPLHCSALPAHFKPVHIGVLRLYEYLTPQHTMHTHQHLHQILLKILMVCKNFRTVFTKYILSYVMQGLPAHGGHSHHMLLTSFMSAAEAR